MAAAKRLSWVVETGHRSSRRLSKAGRFDSCEQEENESSNRRLPQASQKSKIVWRMSQRTHRSGLLAKHGENERSKGSSRMCKRSMLLGDGPRSYPRRCTMHRRLKMTHWVRRCMRGRSHDWTEGPFAHPGEKARRCNPRWYEDSETACREFRKRELSERRCVRVWPCKDGQN
uniref:AtC3H23-like CCCH zinc finger domain-containing protein n=1 Tax=Physcomitrium patens TaxID=3218 RepID=A0A2K1IZC6_PHYPA|nr:hypothetical protein PHYPA_024449 [Physcomitrium patens]